MGLKGLTTLLAPSALLLLAASSRAQGPTAAAAESHSASPPTTSAPKATSTSTPTSTSKTTATKKATTAKPKPGHPTDSAVRQRVAGTPTFEDAALGVDTPESRALRAAERELFPPAMPPVGTEWPDELGSPFAIEPNAPRVHATGVPPVPAPNPLPVAEGGRDLSWMTKLEMPDLPVRWDARVVRYLEFWKDDPRGRSILGTWLRRSGRYKDAIKKTLRAKNVPQDLVYLAMIESGFEAVARSPVGASGLWQFMPETGRAYGLPQDRWADERLNVDASTEAAADYLVDLYRRFGTWDLAMAAYNMGYGGIVQTVRRYNTNDFWALSKMEGSLPWETTLYVPKIIAAAIVGHNLATFGYADLELDAPIDGDEVLVPPGTPLAQVAQAAACSAKDVETLNPELRAQRTPPPPQGETTSKGWPVRVPFGKGALCTQNLAKLHKDSPPTERYVVRFGETLEQIAAARKTPLAKLVELNGVTQGEVVHGGTVLLVPRAADVGAQPALAAPAQNNAANAASATNAASAQVAQKPAVVVPQDVFVYPDRRRVFYRVVTGDTLDAIAGTFKVAVDEIRQWNGIDPAARLVDGMTLQLFVPTGADLSHAVVLTEADVVPIRAGTDEFFTRFGDKGRRRMEVVAKAGETIEALGKRFGVTPSLMERINRRPRSDSLKDGEPVVVYVAQNSPAQPAHAQTHVKSPAGSIPAFVDIAPPAPDALPPLP